MEICQAILRDSIMVGIALLEDMDKAKKQWLEKKLYSKRREIETYDADSDKFGVVNVKIGDPLKVIDIWWGLDRFRPLWIIVETSKGENGYIDTAFSWTNFNPEEWKTERPWEDDFFGYNPREKYTWSTEVWKMINDGNVKIGMTKKQVILSWGKPEKINRDVYRNSVQEQWVYASQYLYFEGDKLTAMQGGE